MVLFRRPPTADILLIRDASEQIGYRFTNPKRSNIGRNPVAHMVPTAGLNCGQVVNIRDGVKQTVALATITDIADDTWTLHILIEIPYRNHINQL